MPKFIAPEQPVTVKNVTGSYALKSLEMRTFLKRWDLKLTEDGVPLTEEMVASAEFHTLRDRFLFPSKASDEGVSYCLSTSGLEISVGFREVVIEQGQLVTV